MSDQGSIALGKRAVASSVSGGCEQERRYLEHLVQGLAEERGFEASIDEQILEGVGNVDVSLVGGGWKIACEICLTPFQDDRLRRIEGYIKARYGEILIIGRTEREAKKQAGLIKGKLREGYCAQITYTAAENLVQHLDDLIKVEAVSESVCGYKVKTRFKEVPPEEMARGRAEIAAVIARSVGRMQTRGED